MNALLVSFLWAQVQITLSCVIFLAIALLLRGRRPQATTALLSGACLVCVLLLAAAVFPQQQWSFAEVIRWYQEGPIKAGVLGGDSARSNPLFGGKTEQTARLGIEEPAVSSTGNTTSGVAGEHSRSTKNLPRDGLRWLSVRLLFLDAQFRQASEANVTKNRASLLSWGLSLLVLFAFLAWLCSWAYARTIARTCLPIVDEGLSQEYRRLTQKLGIPKEPQVLASPHISTGATMGWRRPIIVVNDGFRQWPPHQLAAVLAHELAHAMRRDYLWVVISSLTKVLLWYHPLVHILVRRLRLEQELAADQIAASTLGAKAYGRALAQIALADQNSLRAPSPMLAASQVCVVRRIAMLKQGRLKPQCGKRRWWTSLTLLAVAMSVPLSGLRGQTDRPRQEEPSIVDAEESEEATSAQEFKVSRDEQLAALAEFPPFLAEGTMVYRQDRMKRLQVGKDNAWWARLLQVASIGRNLPTDCVLRGDGGLKLRWIDLAKEHGALHITGKLRSAEHALPGDLSQLLSTPVLSHLVPADETQIVHGRLARSYTGRGLEDKQPLCWVIDDEQGFLRAKTIEGLKAELARTAEDPQIPQVFEADYETASAAVVFSDCVELRRRFQEHIQGSPKQEFEMIVPMLDGLDSLGIFLMPNGGEIRIHASFADTQAAAAVRTLLTGLIETVSRSGDVSGPEQIFLDVISQLEIRQDGVQLFLSMDGGFYAQAAAAEFRETQVDGWVSPFRVERGEGDQGIRLTDATMGLIPNLVQQSVHAADYRGRRLRLTAKVGCVRGLESYCGIAGWSNDVDDAPIAFCSQAADGSSDLRSLFERGHAQPPTTHDAPSKTWKHLAIELNVPDDAASISFGVYGKHAGVEVCEFSISDIGSAQATERECPDFVSAFNVPGRPIQAKPTNLHLECTPELQAESRVAELPSPGNRE